MPRGKIPHTPFHDYFGVHNIIILISEFRTELLKCLQISRTTSTAIRRSYALPWNYSSVKMASVIRLPTIFTLWKGYHWPLLPTWKFLYSAGSPAWKFPEEERTQRHKVWQTYQTWLTLIWQILLKGRNLVIYFRGRWYDSRTMDKAPWVVTRCWASYRVFNISKYMKSIHVSDSCIPHHGRYDGLLEGKKFIPG
jgi:hypothetical protein